MNKKNISVWIAVLGCIMLLSYGCKQQTQHAQQPLPARSNAGNTFSVNGSVREMTIQPETINFPEHEGKSEFMSYCAMCHSLKYISTQPDLSPKAWQAEVTKMAAKFKAPIDSVTCKKIVDYLVVVKGKS